MKLEKDNLWTWKLTDFGESKYGKMYNILLLIFEFAIPVTILIILSILSKIQYDKIIRRKMLMKNETEETKKGTIVFTKMILILAVFFVITRTFYIIGSITGRLSKYSIIQIEEKSVCVYNFALQVAFLQFFTVHAFSGIVYLRMDKNMRCVLLNT